MSNLHILEFHDVGSTPRGALNLPLEPPTAEQIVEITPVSTLSDQLSSSTVIVKLVADADCRIEIAADPDATNSVRTLAAGKAELLGVPAGSKLKIAVSLGFRPWLSIGL
jgi:hypothetical protein